VNRLLHFSTPQFKGFIKRIEKLDIYSPRRVAMRERAEDHVSGNSTSDIEEDDERERYRALIRTVTQVLVDMSHDAAEHGFDLRPYLARLAAVRVAPESRLAEKRGSSALDG
jgi:hypothetical protein